MWGRKMVQGDAEIPSFGGVSFAGQFLCVGLIEFLSSFGKMTSSTMHWHNIGRLRLSVEG